MEQYIRKYALVAEVDNWIEFFTNKKNEEGISQINKVSFVGRITELQGIKDFIDTLEVKEVEEEAVSNDLEEAAKNHKSAIHIVSPQWTSEVEKAFKAGAEWQKEQIIDKACEWLEEHLLDFWSQRITNTDYFIEDFKQAMEE